MFPCVLLLFSPVRLRLCSLLNTADTTECPDRPRHLQPPARPGLTVSEISSSPAGYITESKRRDYLLMANFTGQKPGIPGYKWQTMAFIIIIFTEQKDHGWFHSNNAIPTSADLKEGQLEVFKSSCFFFYGSNPSSGLEVFTMQVGAWLPCCLTISTLTSFSAKLRN